ncbi:MAG: Gfo/Idh/MocA family protein [Thermoanaerobaculia bacterium]
MSPVRVGVVGTGGLGQHHARILAELPRAEMVGVFDQRQEVAREVAARHGLEVHDSLECLAAASEALVLAIPTVAHTEVGCPLLERGLHLLVEKPMAASLEGADRLREAAARGGGVLAVGHVEFYNPAVQALLALGASPRFVEVQRLGVFSPRSLDVDVVLDLMIHDLQILQALDGTPVAEIRATGVPVLSDRADIANVRLAFESGCVANLTASRVSSERVRKLRVFLASRYLSIDYQAQEVKGYRLEEAGGQRSIVPADIEVEKQEPLRAELEAFLAACRGEAVSLVGGDGGRAALATALAVMEQIG